MKLSKLWRKSNKKSAFYIYRNIFFYNKVAKFCSLPKTDLSEDKALTLNTNFDSGYAKIVHIRPRFRNPSDPLPTIPINNTVTYLELDFNNHNTYFHPNEEILSDKFENIYMDVDAIYLPRNPIRSTTTLSNEACMSQNDPTYENIIAIVKKLS